jgi:hypothetical protein
MELVTNLCVFFFVGFVFAVLVSWYVAGFDHPGLL